MKYYFRNLEIVSLADEIHVKTTLSYKDRFKNFVLLTENQVQFYEQHLYATSEEVYHCALRKEFTMEDRRRLAYSSEIPNDLKEAYLTYMAEGDTIKAANMAAKIAHIKQKIRQKYTE